MFFYFNFMLKFRYERIPFIAKSKAMNWWIAWGELDMSEVQIASISNQL